MIKKLKSFLKTKQGFSDAEEFLDELKQRSMLTQVSIEILKESVKTYREIYDLATEIERYGNLILETTIENTGKPDKDLVKVLNYMNETKKEIRELMELNTHGIENLKQENLYREFFDEAMARIIDSLYSCYFGEYTQDKLPLTESDLKFLERFRYKGKPMFGKAISKYRLGLQMKEDGYSPEEIGELLEYATEFTYRGKKYKWPENNFRIKGRIPELVN